MCTVLGPKHSSLAIAALLCLVTGAHAQQGGAVPMLAYDDQTRGPVPIPASERGLQTVLAEPWFKVTEQRMVLEGPCFDRNGNLFFFRGVRRARAAPDAGQAHFDGFQQTQPRARRPRGAQ